MPAREAKALRRHPFHDADRDHSYCAPRSVVSSKGSAIMSPPQLQGRAAPERSASGVVGGVQVLP